MKIRSLILSLTLCSFVMNASEQSRYDQAFFNEQMRGLKSLQIPTRQGDNLYIATQREDGQAIIKIVVYVASTIDAFDINHDYYKNDDAQRYFKNIAKYCCHDEMLSGLFLSRHKNIGEWQHWHRDLTETCLGVFRDIAANSIEDGRRNLH